MISVVVLHIDDDAEFRETFKYLLEKTGFSVISRRDSHDASGLEAGREFSTLVVDHAGFAFAAEIQHQQEECRPLIVLSSCPQSAEFDADALIYKSDPQWDAKLVETINSFPERVPPIIAQSQKAFERHLDDLLVSHYREWVAYRGDECLGFGQSETELYERCFRQGLKQDEFIVRSVEPLVADDEIVFAAQM